MADDSVSRIVAALAQTWPAKAAQSAWGAVKLPGDVYQGNVSMYGADGRTNPAVIDRSADLAGMVMGGGMPMAERGALGMAGGKMGLPMDEASRLARAQEQGFDTSRTLYHGTSSEFDSFKTNRGGITDLTDRPEIAEIYANIRHEGGQHRHARDWGRDVNAGPNILPVYAKAKNPLVISDQGPGGGGWLADNLAAALGVEYKSGPTAYRALFEEARKRGHDQIEVRNMSDLGGDQTQIFMLNPSDIRSKFAAFDPAKIGANEILGGLAALPAAGIVGASMKEPSPDQQIINLLAGQ